MVSRLSDVHYAEGVADYPKGSLLRNDSQHNASCFASIGAQQELTFMALALTAKRPDLPDHTSRQRGMDSGQRDPRPKWREFRPACRNIGNVDLIDKRSKRDVPVPPDGTLSDHVPFYFTPFSIIMFNIRTGYGVK